MTYSIIIVQDHKIGIGVVSGSVAVGSRVPYIRYPHCGIVSQGYTNPALSPIIADLIERGERAKSALNKALRLDTDPEARQVAVLTANLDKAIHVGAKVPLNKGAYMDHDFIVVANLVEEDVVKSMANAAKSKKDLSVRLYEALLAGNAVGGDLRGDRSATLLIHGKTPFSPYYNVILDVRVDYSKAPLRDLRRILEAYGVHL